MNSQHLLKSSLFLTIAICAVMSGFATLNTTWVYAQNNLPEVLNQTSNQTSNQTTNQSVSSAIPGQQGGTPPKTGPS
jgi:hypothetical protein